MLNDSDITFAMFACSVLSVRVHVQGTDERPVILITDKRTRREVGGIELNKRIENYLKKGG